jgi:hypothetical protein
MILIYLFFLLVLIIYLHIILLIIISIYYIFIHSILLILHSIFSSFIILSHIILIYHLNPSYISIIPSIIIHSSSFFSIPNILPSSSSHYSILILSISYPSISSLYHNPSLILLNSILTLFIYSSSLISLANTIFSISQSSLYYLLNIILIHYYSHSYVLSLSYPHPYSLISFKALIYIIIFLHLLYALLSILFLNQYKVMLLN